MAFVEQMVTLTSQRVDEMEEVIRSVGELIEQDVVAVPEEPPFTIPNWRSQENLEMVAAASEDARTRAQQIAAESKGSLGGLREASLGVFQVWGKYANRGYSWGGNFNTSSKEKTVSITVTADFMIK